MIFSFLSKLRADLASDLLNFDVMEVKRHGNYEVTSVLISLMWNRLERWQI